MKTSKAYIFFLLAFVILAGCSDKDIYTLIEDESEKITEVQIIALESPMQQISRAMKDNPLKAKYKWVYENSGVHMQTEWSADGGTSTGTNFSSVTTKQYRIVVMCNVMSFNDLDTTNPDNFANFWLDYQTVLQSGMIPLSYYEKDVFIPYNYGRRYYYYVRMKRSLAKVAVNVNVAAHAGDITLHSLEICNVPDKVKVFDLEPTVPVDLNYKELAVSDAVITGNTITATVYLPENMQGENPAITTPEEKYAENAPSNATYIRIGALVSGQPVNYHIYLGENKTEDFNLRRNTFHTYNITITGADPNDRRIEFTFDND